MRRRLLAVGLAMVAVACSPGPPTQTVAPVPSVAPATASPVTASSATAAPATEPPATAPPTPVPTGPGTTPATAGACPSVPARLGPRGDRPRYVVSVAVDVAAHRATGRTTVAFTPDVATDRIVLRLWPNAPIPAARGGHLEPGPVTVDGREVAAQRPDPTTLVLPGALAAAAAVSIDVAWTLAIPADLSERWSVSGGAVRLGTFGPLLAWQPGVGWAVDPPTRVHGEATTSTVADWDLTVDAGGLPVLASGVQDRPGHFVADAVRDVGLSAGRFTLATATIAASATQPTPVAVTVGVAAGIAEAPATYLAKAVAVIGRDAARFGPYPYPTYTLAVTPGLTGGIEHPSFVMQGPGSIGRSTSHEIAHEWFYALVGNDQGRDPVLDEGLATWAEAGDEGTLASFRARVIPPAAVGHAGEPTTFYDAKADTYYRGVYVQGTQALAALGPPALVDCALAVYVARFAHRIATRADLVGVLTATFPDAPAVLARYGLRP